MNGTTRVAFKYGSSDRYSKLRPAMGERAMLTPGPRRKLTLRARASRPRASPILRASSVSQLAASEAPEAYAVVGPQVRTPTEASDILKRGRSMADVGADMGRVYMLLMPPSSSIFCSSVSLE